MKSLLRLLPLLFLPPLAARETTAKSGTPAAGHSYHGEVFNEGPRQAAVLIPGTGAVHLEVTTKSGEARRFFAQGVGQLHGYWFFEAERSFRQAAKLDPDAAMFYWGMAMANFKNDNRGKKFIDEAVKRREKVSDREKLWIDGLAAYFKDPKADAKKRLRDYVRSLEKILEKHPGEVEARPSSCTRSSTTAARTSPSRATTRRTCSRRRFSRNTRAIPRTISRSTCGTTPIRRRR